MASASTKPRIVSQEQRSVALRPTAVARATLQNSLLSPPQWYETYVSFTKSTYAYGWGSVPFRARVSTRIRIDGNGESALPQRVDLVLPVTPSLGKADALALIATVLSYETDASGYRFPPNVRLDFDAIKATVGIGELVGASLEVSAVTFDAETTGRLFKKALVTENGAFSPHWVALSTADAAAICSTSACDWNTTTLFCWPSLVGNTPVIKESEDDPADIPGFDAAQNEQIKSLDRELRFLALGSTEQYRVYGFLRIRGTLPTAFGTGMRGGDGFDGRGEWIAIEAAVECVAWMSTPSSGNASGTESWYGSFDIAVGDTLSASPLLAFPGVLATGDVLTKTPSNMDLNVDARYAIMVRQVVVLENTTASAVSAKLTTLLPPADASASGLSAKSVAIESADAQGTDATAAWGVFSAQAATDLVAALRATFSLREETREVCVPGRSALRLCFLDVTPMPVFAVTFEDLVKEKDGEGAVTRVRWRSGKVRVCGNATQDVLLFQQEGIPGTFSANSAYTYAYPRLLFVEPDENGDGGLPRVRVAYEVNAGSQFMIDGDRANH